MVVEELVVAVRCAACPWGLDVQGDDADAVAVRLACRHGDKTGHAVELRAGQ